MLRSLWFRRLLLATVVPLLLVEGLLQIGALAVATFAPSREGAAGGDGCAVLCVGDSYTYGLGASRAEHSYPAVLGELLRERPIDGGKSRVVNAGWPGRNSREVVGLVPRLIEEFRPRRIAILVGVNDLWAHPDHVEIQEPEDAPAHRDSSSRFRFEWRLPRLVALALHPPNFHGLAIASGRAPPPEDATRPSAPASTNGAEAPPPKRRLTGTWNVGHSVLDLGADGSARMDGVSMKWTATPEEILFVREGIAYRARWTIQGDRLRLIVAGDKLPRDFVRSAPPERTDWSAQAWQAIAAADLPKALQIVQTWNEREPEVPWAHYMLVVVAKRMARTDLADEALSWLRARARSYPDVWGAEALVTALWEANLPEEAGQVARTSLEKWPESVMLWTALADSAEMARDMATLERAVEKAIALDPRRGAYPLAHNLRLRQRLRLARSDLRGATCDALAAFAVDSLEGELRNALHREGMKCGPALVDELAADAGLSGEKLEAAKRVAADSFAQADDPAAEILFDHLRQIVRYCRARDVEPILLTYPFHGDAVERAQRRVAQESGVAVVEIRARFDVLLTQHSREELFVPDGHCNDLGYRFMAEEVAKALRRH